MCDTELLPAGNDAIGFRQAAPRKIRRPQPDQRDAGHRDGMRRQLVEGSEVGAARFPIWPEPMQVSEMPPTMLEWP